MSGSTGPLLFIVPARGGSKGLPGKNIALMGGRPLISYVLSAARAAIGQVDSIGSRLVVTTDSPDIADVARRWGAEAPFLRPRELADDSSIDVDALIHALDWLRDSDGFEPEAVVELQAPSPLLAPEDILGAIELHRRSGDTVLSVSPSRHTPFWSFALDEAGRLQPVLPQAAGALRRQDLPPTVHLNGAISVIAPAVLRAGRTFLTPRTRGYVMPEERSVDIDTALDLTVAAALLRPPRQETAPPAVQVGTRRIGADEPCFVIAEAGVNHNGDLALAHSLIDAAADAGADAVKFQVFRAEALCAADTPKESYQREATGSNESQLAMLRTLELPIDAFAVLKRHAEQRSIEFMATPLDEESVDVLRGLGVSAIKVGSGELTHTPLLRHIARSGTPILLSTGMSTLTEVAEAVAVIRSEGESPLALFHCRGAAAGHHAADAM